MYTDKTNGEGQVFARQTSSVEGKAEDRAANMATPTSTTPEITSATETAKMAAADVVVVVAIVAASVAGAASVAVSVAAVIAVVVAVGVSTLTALSDAVPSTLFFCLAQTCLSPFVLSLSTLVLLLFRQATFCAACACMHLRTCGPHHV